MTDAKPDFSGLCARARTMIALGQIEHALGIYDEVLRIDPANAMALADRGTAHAMLRKLDPAKRDLTQALALGYEEASVYCSLATVYLESGDPRAALPYFARALALDARYPLVFYNRSRALHELGEYRAAIADLQACLACNPDDDMRILIQRRLEMLRDGAAPDPGAKKP